MFGFASAATALNKELRSQIIQLQLDLRAARHRQREAEAKAHGINNQRDYEYRKLQIRYREALNHIAELEGNGELQRLRDNEKVYLAAFAQRGIPVVQAK